MPALERGDSEKGGGDAGRWIDRIDRLAETGMDHVGQQIPRRRLLGRAGTAVLTLIGVTAVERVLPFQAPYEAQAIDRAHCPDWFFCGLWGRMCDCDGCHNGPHNCPGCSIPSGSWCRCCQEPGGCDRKVIYRDCYKGDCTNQQVSDCEACTFCTRNGNVTKTLWDPPSGGGAYMCTAAIVMDCAMCNDCP
jgi:hypothetical protein